MQEGGVARADTTKRDAIARRRGNSPMRPDLPILVAGRLSLSHPQLYDLQVDAAAVV